ncbi:DNA mismatch repair protein MutS [Altererythrobacter aerius]|uniref:DNA mismatch repair protein MutS n=1 Tax=Tsuneonella aeria TaxID=1837929 RepID=A0A6I4TEB1_9SPHN|nr:Smr/MutS family protein [Tsuneonella aeria]MXO74997.1 DNA mismatch repair protein MutS [Tsuneonella aeria]
MKAPRGLSAEEAAAWAHVAATVTALHPVRSVKGAPHGSEDATPVGKAATPPPSLPPRHPPQSPRLPASPGERTPSASPGLDSHWDRRFRAGAITPDFTLDLHGHTLDQAHARLDAGLSQAKAMGARVVLVIAGKPRPVDAADRGSRRGAIRAKVLDWLAAGPHRSDIAAIRPAHRRHGAEGAFYLVLKRRR